MKPRRRFIKVIGLLLLGAAINVAVAWGLAFFGPVGEAHYARPNVDVAEVARLMNVDLDLEGATAVAWGELRKTPNDSGLIPIGPFPESFTTALSAGGLKAWWVDFMYTLPTGRHRFVVHKRFQAGWPMLSFESRLWRDWGSGRTWIIGGKAVPIKSRLVDQSNWMVLVRDRVLPLQIIWPDFAINTVFYAGVLWVLFCGPFALRRMIRRRRGQCPACAYPVGSSEICTECGAPRVMPAAPKAGIQNRSGSV